MKMYTDICHHEWLQDRFGTHCQKCGQENHSPAPPITTFTSPWRWQNRMGGYFFKLWLGIIALVILKHVLQHHS